MTRLFLRRHIEDGNAMTGTTSSSTAAHRQSAQPASSGPPASSSSMAAKFDALTNALQQAVVVR
jgi:hypothetical protein